MRLINEPLNERFLPRFISGIVLFLSINALFGPNWWAVPGLYLTLGFAVWLRLRAEDKAKQLPAHVIITTPWVLFCLVINRRILWQRD